MVLMLETAIEASLAKSSELRLITGHFSEVMPVPRMLLQSVSYNMKTVKTYKDLQRVAKSFAVPSWSMSLRIYWTSKLILRKR